MRFLPFLTSARILFLSASQLVATRRDRHGLKVVARFPAEEKGYAAFRAYLSAPPQAPIYLVADLIEEEFRVETIPHVLGSDRRSLFERKLAQLFRTTPYQAAQIQGREKSGRRDDRVLFTALTGSEQLTPWLARILDAKAPLAGITSIPLLGESQAAPYLPEKRPHLLLVSHQAHSGLRQIYLRDGRIQFSRLTGYIPPPLPGQEDLLPSTLIEECLRTRQYLERQRFIDHRQSLELLVLAEADEYQRLQGLESNSPLLVPRLHDLGPTARKLKLPLLPGIGIASLALVHNQPAGGLPNHYAPAILRRYHRIRRFRQALLGTTAVVLLASLVAAALLLAAGNRDRHRQLALHRESSEIRAQAEERRRQFPLLPLSAENLKKTVQALDRIRRLPTPLPMLALVSRALSTAPEIQLHRFAWAITPAAPANAADGASPSLATATDSLTQPFTTSLLPAMATGKTEVGGILVGTIRPFVGQRAAHDSLQRLLARLTKNAGITATLLEEPLETRPEKGITAQVGGSETEPGFSLKLTAGAAP